MRVIDAVRKTIALFCRFVCLLLGGRVRGGEEGTTMAPFHVDTYAAEPLFRVSIREASDDSCKVKASSSNCAYFTQRPI